MHDNYNVKNSLLYNKKNKNNDFGIQNHYFHLIIKHYKLIYYFLSKILSVI